VVDRSLSFVFGADGVCEFRKNKLSRNEHYSTHCNMAKLLRSKKHVLPGYKKISRDFFQWGMPFCMLEQRAFVS